MKRLLLVLVATMSVSLSAIAQDLIVLVNTEEIQAKVKTIGLQEVVYSKWNNLEGPTYTLPKSEIFFIKYANGQKETFSNQAQVLNTAYIATKKSKENFSKSKFQGYTLLGADFNNILGGPSIDASFGSLMSKYLYLGGGVGFHNLIGEYIALVKYMNEIYYTQTAEWMYSIYITTDLKLYTPNIGNFYPRFDISLGVAYGGLKRAYILEENIRQDRYNMLGFYMSAGAGFDYRRLSFGVGFQMPILKGSVIPLGYARIGLRFGKK